MQRLAVGALSVLMILLPLGPTAHATECPVTMDLVVTYDDVADSAELEWYPAFPEQADTFEIRCYDASGALASVVTAAAQDRTATIDQVVQLGLYEVEVCALDAGETEIEVTPRELFPIAGEYQGQSDSTGVLDISLVTCDSRNFPFIYLTVRVTEDGQPIGDLTSDNFLVIEDGQLQTDFFHVTPPDTGGGVRLADIVFLIDTSGSMGGEIAGVRDNAIAFANALGATGIDYRLGLVQFGNSSGANPRIIGGGLTADAPTFVSWVSGLSASGGWEPGFEAIRLAIQNYNFRPGSQKVFIMITDEDSDDRQKQATIDLILANDVTVHCAARCSYGTSEGDYCNETSVRGVSGGLLFPVEGPYDDVLDAIAEDVGNTYIVRYRTDNPDMDGQERQVICTVTKDSSSDSVQCTYIPGGAPMIERTPETLALHDQPLYAGATPTIAATVTDAAAPFVQSVTLHVRVTASGSTYTEVGMGAQGGDVYAAQVPGSLVQDPGLDYYLRATDGQVTSSDPSTDPQTNPYQIAVLPNHAPVIEHTPPSSASPGQDLPLTVHVVDNTFFIAAIQLHYRPQGALLWSTESVSYGDPGPTDVTETLTIPASAVVEPAIEYYIQATDDHGVSSPWPDGGGADAPHVLPVGGGVVEPWYFVHITDPHVVNNLFGDYEIWTDALAGIRAMGPGVSGGYVGAIAIYDDGGAPALYAGGLMPTAGGIHTSHIAKWDGVMWSRLGTGMNWEVQALAVFDDALYAGGQFHTAGGFTVNHIAKWTGTMWSPLNHSLPLKGGTDEDTHALHVYNGELVAGGRFNTAGGVNASGIARWNGMSWNAMGSGVDGGVVATLAVYGAELVAGGSFTSAGGVDAQYIATWDGTGWSAVGSPGGWDDWVRELAVFDDGTGPALYAGGYFETAAGIDAHHIARWNGANWSALGGGVNDTVYALVVFDDGSGPALYVGGSFTSAGGVDANYIAKWDGTAWSSVGSAEGVDGWVFELAVFDDGGGPELYAGGDFETADGLDVHNIARWDGTTWSAMGSRPDFVLCSGDLVDSGQGPVGVLNYGEFLDHLYRHDGTLYIDTAHEIPILFCPGNHDARRVAPAPPYSFANYHGYIGLPDYYSFVYKNCAVLSLNSGADDWWCWPPWECWFPPEGDGLSDGYGNELTLFAQDLDMLDGVANGTDTSSLVKVAMTHHPYESSDGVFLGGRGEFSDACTAYEVDLLLCGHRHGYTGVSPLSCDPTQQAFGGSVIDGDFRRLSVYSDCIKAQPVEQFWSALGGHVSCRAAVHVHDGDGYHNGPDANGDIERGIPHSYYSHWVADDDDLDIHLTYTEFSVYKAESKDYVFAVESLSDEPITVTLYSSLLGGIRNQATYDDVPMFTGSVATIRADESIIDYTMYIEDPDGSVREVLPSSWEGDLRPLAPSVPVGQTLGVTGIAYPYSSSAEDPEGQAVYYKFDWGDDTMSEWLGPFASAEACTASHMWEQPGTYSVSVRAKDAWDHMSDWSEALCICIDGPSAPPVVSCSVTTDVLWAPDHHLVDVGLTTSVFDECDPIGAAESLIIEVWSDETEMPDTGDGTGRHAPDAKDIDTGLRLRKERRGAEDGRVYLIIARAEDASGNVGFGYCTVVVPHDQSQESLDEVAAQAATALAIVDTTPGETIADKVAPLVSQGWTQHGVSEELGPHQ